MRRFFAVLWSLLWVALAAGLVWLSAQALPAWDTNAALMAMPDYDYLAQAEALRKAERFSEALLVVDAGLAASTDVATRNAFELERNQIQIFRDDWLRRLGDAGQGALTGTGDSVEALAGAVVADLFVFGDVRDLVIQGGRRLRGEETDEVIVALSAAGIVLTAIPTADFGTAVLKFARRVGALSEAFARRLVKLLGTAAEERNLAPVVEVAGDAASLARAVQPAAAVAILKHVDDPLVLKAAARVAQRPSGGFALWVGEKPALDLLQAGKPGEDLLLRAAAKGRGGVDFAARNLGLLTRAHPLIGIFKGLYKYNLPRLLANLLATRAPLVLGLFFGWLVYECLLLAHRIAGRRSPRPREPVTFRREPRTGAGAAQDRGDGRRDPVV